MRTLKRSPVLVVAATLLVSSITGCSFIFSEGPPSRHEALVHFNCGESYAPPVVDTVVSGLMLLSAASIRSSNKVENPSLLAGTYLAMGVLTGASAIYGYTVVPGCKEAQELRLARNVRQQSLPPPYGLPPYGQPPPTWPPPTFELKTPAAPPAPPAPSPK
jgi:hypothetical protein